MIKTISFILLLSCLASLSLADDLNRDVLPASLDFKSRLMNLKAGEDKAPEVYFKDINFYLNTPVKEGLMLGNRLFLSSPGQEWVEFLFGDHNYTFNFINDLVVSSCSPSMDGGDMIAETSYGTFYCFKEDNSTINEIDPVLGFKIVNSYAVPSQLKRFSVKNDLIIMSSEPTNLGIFYEIFDTRLKQFKCPIRIDDSYQILDSIALDNYLILATKSRWDSVDYIAIDCTDLTNVTISQDFTDISGGVSWRTLNQSTTLVNFVRTKTQLYVFAMRYLNNRFQIGRRYGFMVDSSVVSTGFNLQLNDMHLIFTYQDSYGYNNLGLFYFDSNLNIVLDRNIRLSDFAASVADIIRIKGTNDIVVNLQSMSPIGHQIPMITSFLRIDALTFEIVDAQSLFPFLDIPRFRLENGAFVDLSLLGVSITPLDQNFTRVFYPYPVWDYHMSSRNDDIIWGLYTPSYSKRPGFDQCYLSKIQKSTNTVDRVFINPICPCGDVPLTGDRLISLLDVYVDSDGYHNFAYRCGGNFFIVVGNIMHTVEDDSYAPTAREPLVFVDYIKGLLNVINFGIRGQVILDTYEITSGVKIENILLAQCLACEQVGAKVTGDIAVFTNKTDIASVSPVIVYRISDRKVLFTFNLPAPTLDGIVPLAVDLWHNSIAWLFVASFTDRPLYVYTPYGQSTDVPGFHYGSTPISFVSNYTFAIEHRNGWIGEIQYYYAKPYWIPASAGIMTMSMAVLLVVLSIAFIF